jgi:hypothetical protein
METGARWRVACDLNPWERGESDPAFSRTDATRTVRAGYRFGCGVNLWSIIEMTDLDGHVMRRTYAAAARAMFDRIKGGERRDDQARSS